MKISVFTQTYNSEQTVRRCIQSIVRQTYTDWVYCIYDNGSTDGTVEIIREMAQSDNRIIGIFDDENRYWHMIKDMQEILGDSEWFLQLDADDEYAQNTMEELLKFALENDLDISGCPSDFIDATTNTSKNELSLCADMIICGIDFEKKFPAYFRYVRDSYGKLFRASLLKKIDYDSMAPTVLNGSVSIVCAEALKHTTRLGILHKRLHRYYIYPQSFERAGVRFVTSKIYSTWKRMLEERFGRCSEENKCFLYWKYLTAVHTKYILALNGRLSDRDTIPFMDMLLFDDFTVDVMQTANPHISSAQKYEFLQYALNWCDVTNVECSDFRQRLLLLMARVV